MDFFLTRFFVVFQQVLLASRTHISIQTASDTDMLSYLSLFYGFGSVMGPSVGSILSSMYQQHNTSGYADGSSTIGSNSTTILQPVALFATGISLVSTISVLLFDIGSDPSHRRAGIPPRRQSAMAFVLSK